MGIISQENIEREESGESGVSGMIGLTIHGLFKDTLRGSDSYTQRIPEFTVE